MIKLNNIIRAIVHFRLMAECDVYIIILYYTTPYTPIVYLLIRRISDYNL